MLVGVHVVLVNIGDDRNRDRQVQKRGIRLIGFSHDVIAFTQTCVHTRAVEFAANHESWIQSALAHHARHQRCRGGFAMRARDANPAFKSHQFSQHHRTRHNRNFARTRRQHFRILLINRS